ncbi:MAG TPA: UMP kinase [Candidatus Thermoplasmatota archaeon]
MTPVKPALAISAGGSIMVPDAPDVAYVKQLAQELRSLTERYRVLVVAGGGKVARNYIHAGRQLGADESTLDVLGIDVTRLNARVLIAALGEHALARPPHHFDEAIEASRAFPVVVMGGTQPGHTTDAVTAMLGERARAVRLIILTNVDGVYTRDPRLDPKARRIDAMTAAELVAVTAGGSHKAGSTGVVDAMACRIIQRARIPACVLHGRDFDALRAAAEGRPFKGTAVAPDAT